MGRGGGSEFTKNQYRGGIAYKEEGRGFGQLADLRGVGLARKRWGMFLKGGGGVIPRCTLCNSQLCWCNKSDLLVIANCFYSVIK